MEWFCVCSKSIVNTTCNAGTGKQNIMTVIYPNKLGRFGMMYMASFYGLWNLDFFLFLYNLTCVSPTITATQSYFIEVAIGVYPLVLLVILY